MLDFRAWGNRELGAKSRRLREEKQVSSGFQRWKAWAKKVRPLILTIVAATSAWLLIVHDVQFEVLSKALSQHKIIKVVMLKVHGTARCARPLEGESKIPVCYSVNMLPLVLDECYGD